MKSMKSKIVYIVCFVLFSSIPVFTMAQDDRQGRTDFSGHWQLGTPVGDEFAENFGGWGANFEGHYYVTNRIAVGAFVSWQTYIKYYNRQTYPLKSGAGDVTMDKYQTVFELPFGLSSKFHFLPSSGLFDPYFGLKLGANYSEQHRYYNIFEDYDDNWGFVVLPELGVTISPLENKAVGLHLALFYSYSTNKSDYFDLSGLSDFGFRVGLNFRF